MEHVNTSKETKHSLKISHDEAIVIKAAVGGISGTGYWRNLADRIHDCLEQKCEVTFSESHKLLDGELTLTTKVKQ
jgi:hypothetical protein